MRARLRCLLVILGLLLIGAPIASAAGGAASNARWYIAPFVGYTFMDTDYGKIAIKNSGFSADDAVYFGGRLGKTWESALGFELAGGYMSTKVSNPTPTAGADLSFWNYSLNVVYSPIVGKMGGPFLSGGFGFGTGTLSNASGAGVTFPGNNTDHVEGLLDLAAGWQFPVGENMGLRLEARNLLWIPDDGIESADLNYLIFGGAFAFNFGGKPKDADLDGVPDKKDACPNTPSGAKVDAKGCPIDSDGDGVFDGLDTCPDTPKGATVNAQGCPMDTDGDGVLDGIDQCADTPKGATVDATGCPRDSDGDGVFDGLDQCANTPTGVKVDASGCPLDTDGDGVFDGLDKCPNTPAGAKVDAEGCPIEITERETEMLDTGLIRLQNIEFETGKADIAKESYATLDIVGQLLTRWPDLKIEIGGHTDSRGAAKMNQALSEQRAQAVKDYLTGHFPGLQGEQYTVKGYGESKPLVPNKGEVNMSKNRRVEFTVLNKDVLKKESERRKTLQK
jgi:outer membrane protein OmpA-like peptidoglycan-associated protein